MRTYHWILVVCLGLLLGAGNQPDMLRIHVAFDGVDRLQEGDDVVLDAQPVGYVEKLAYVQDGFFRVTLSIDKTFAPQLSENSRFIISDHTGETGKKTVRIVQTRSGGRPLASGSTVKGSDKYAVMLEKIRGDIQDSVDFLKREMDAFAEEIRRLSEDEKIKALEMEMKRIARAMKEASRETREKIEKEIVPLMKKEMEALRERLRENGREEEMAPLDQEMQRILRI